MEAAPLRTLITGGAGFIGAHLAARCISEGEDVHVIARPGRSLHRLAPLGWGVTVHRLDLNDDAATLRCLAEIAPDRVFHLSSETRLRSSPDIDVAAEAQRMQTTTLTNLLKVLSEISRSPMVMVRAGSIAEYGPSLECAREEQRERPATPYGAAMHAGTHLCEMLQPALSFPLITARLAFAYGPGQSSKYLIPQLIDHCLEGRAFSIQRPSAQRDMIFIDDVIEALRRIAAVRPPHLVLNVATGIAPDIRSIAEEIVNATGAPPDLFSFVEHAMGDDRIQASPRRAARALHWRARTKLADGLAQTIAARHVERARLTAPPQ